MTIKNQTYVPDALSEINSLRGLCVNYSRQFVEIAGSVYAALLLSQALFWQNRVPENRDGWWWKTQKQWEEETGLTRTMELNARRLLEARGLVETKKKGIPCRTWYRVNLIKLREELAKANSSEATVDAETHGPDCADHANKEAQKVHAISKTSPKNTKHLTKRREPNLEELAAAIAPRLPEVENPQAYLCKIAGRHLADGEVRRVLERAEAIYAEQDGRNREARSQNQRRNELLGQISGCQRQLENLTVLYRSAELGHHRDNLQATITSVTNEMDVAKAELKALDEMARDKVLANSE